MINAIDALEGELNEGSVIIGSTDYNDLQNKPSINGIELTGDKTLDELNIQPKGDYANKTDIPTVPTKISEFENDLGYITSIPEYYITEEGLNNKGYITEIPTVPTKLSELENDSNYITSIPEEYVTEEELNNKGYITSIPEDYAKKEYVDGKIGDIETILSTLATVSEE